MTTDNAQNRSLNLAPSLPSCACRRPQYLCHAHCPPLRFSRAVSIAVCNSMPPSLIHLPMAHFETTNIQICQFMSQVYLLQVFHAPRHSLRQNSLQNLNFLHVQGWRKSFDLSPLGCMKTMNEIKSSGPLTLPIALTVCGIHATLSHGCRYQQTVSSALYMSVRPPT